MNELLAIVAYLFEEVKEARSRAVSPADEFQMQVLMWRARRHTRRLERLAEAIGKLDAETTPQ